MDLTIEGKAFIKGNFDKCCIGIKDGKIHQIKKILKSDKHLNFGNKLILPAGVDIHVHFRDPGFTNKEDFSSGSLAAANGGISCVFDMPNTMPQTTSISTLNDKIKSADSKSYVDFGVYVGITDENIEFIEPLAKKCSGFKIYLGSTTNTLLLNNKNLKESLSKIGKTNKIALIHAEDEVCLENNKAIVADLSGYKRIRPAKCEELSINNILSASKEIASKVHICHISSCEGLELLRERPNNISCGVTPHHSLLSIEKTPDLQTHYKVNPPIRTIFDKEFLFNGLKKGFVDIIESDHAPHTLDEKDMDFNSAPSGIPGVETMLPLYLYLAKKEFLSLQRLISVMCEKPAKLVGIPKGKIEIGRDADIIVVDIKNDCKIKSQNLHSKCRWTPFEGWPAIFPSHTFVRGKKLIEDHEIQMKQGFGRFVGE
jgi:dihydroorotase